MLELLALMTALTTADPSLQVTPERPRLQKLDGGSVGTVSFTVTLHNQGKTALEIAPDPLEVTTAEGSKPVAACAYTRALVTETAGKRRKFTTFSSPLAPGEKVSVRLFFTWPKGAALPAGELMMKVIIPAEGGAAGAVSRPFLPEAIGGI
ncbi:MAG: hypothetical protein ACI9OJ_005284 [Myxococcota bacterium]|jgi:hypothetical protein